MMARGTAEQLLSLLLLLSVAVFTCSSQPLPASAHPSRTDLLQRRHRMRPYQESISMMSVGDQRVMAQQLQQQQLGQPQHQQQQLDQPQQQQQQEAPKEPQQQQQQQPQTQPPAVAPLPTQQPQEQQQPQTQPPAVAPLPTQQPHEQQQLQTQPPAVAPLPTQQPQEQQQQQQTLKEQVKEQQPLREQPALTTPQPQKPQEQQQPAPSLSAPQQQPAPSLSAPQQQLPAQQPLPVVQPLPTPQQQQQQQQQPLAQPLPAPEQQQQQQPLAQPLPAPQPQLPAQQPLPVAQPLPVPQQQQPAPSLPAPQQQQQPKQASQEQQQVQQPMPAAQLLPTPQQQQQPVQQPLPVVLLPAPQQQQQVAEPLPAPQQPLPAQQPLPVAQPLPTPQQQQQQQQQPLAQPLPAPQQQQQQQPLPVAQPLPTPQQQQPAQQPLPVAQPLPAPQQQLPAPQQQTQQPQQQVSQVQQPKVASEPLEPMPQQQQPPKPQEQPHAVPAKQPQQEQQQSAGNAKQVVSPSAPLLPSCVPKYALDLFIPPPMPVSTTTFSKKRRASTSGVRGSAARGARAAVASVDSTDAVDWSDSTQSTVTAAEGEVLNPAHVGIASMKARKSIRVVKKIIKVREQYASGAEDNFVAPADAPAAADSNVPQPDKKPADTQAEEVVDGEELHIQPTPKQSEDWWYGAAGAEQHQQKQQEQPAPKSGAAKSREETLKRLADEVKLHEDNIRRLEAKLEQRQKKARVNAEGVDKSSTSDFFSKPEHSNNSTSDVAATQPVDGEVVVVAPQVPAAAAPEQPQAAAPQPAPAAQTPAAVQPPLSQLQEQPEVEEPKQPEAQQPKQPEVEQPKEPAAQSLPPPEKVLPVPEQQPQEKQAITEPVELKPVQQPPAPQQPEKLAQDAPQQQPAAVVVPSQPNTTTATPDNEVKAHAPAAAAPPAPAAGEAPKLKQVPPPVPVFDSYDISVRQVQQRVLPAASLPGPGCPASFGPTTVFAFGPENVATQPFHNWPGFTVEAQRNVPTRIRWSNSLADAAGNYLPHILKEAIDQTVTWANPQAIGGSADSSPCKACSTAAPFACATDAGCVTASTTTYTGPVPIVTHVQGQQDVADWADGYPEAWYLPDAGNLAGFTPVGSWYNTFHSQYTAATGGIWAPGSAEALYQNTQRPNTAYYHDQTLGLSRTNVYAGMAGFFFVRERFPSLANGPELPGLPYPAYDGIVPTSSVRELPLAIQDRAFTTNGQLWYPTAAHAPGTFLPNGPLHPLWIPELFADVIDPADPRGRTVINMLMMTVNGRAYPRHTVYPDAYRLRLFNGCNSRTLQLRFARSSTPALMDPLATAETVNVLPFWVVGNDAGFFPQLQPDVTTLLMGPGERYDVVIDFTRLSVGEFVYLLNNGPETAYVGVNIGEGLTEHTAQVMRFDVQPLPADETARPFDLAQQVLLNNALIADWAANVAPIVPAAGAQARQVSILEQLTPDNIPIALLLGTVAAGANGANTGVPQLWVDPVTTDTATDATAVWDIINLSEVAQPVALHNTEFEFLGRFAIVVDPLDPAVFTKTTAPVPNAELDSLLTLACPVSTANPTGRCPARKDTVIVMPGSYTRIAFRAPANAGLYVWHCSTLEHKDNGAAAPHCFGSPTYINPRTGLTMCPGPN